MPIWCAHDHCLCFLQGGDIENISKMGSVVCKRYFKIVVAHPKDENASTLKEKRVLFRCS
jgi:hypothetical protein